MIQDPKGRVSVSLGCSKFDRSFMLVPAIASFFLSPPSHVGSEGVCFDSQTDRQIDGKKERQNKHIELHQASRSHPQSLDFRSSYPNPSLPRLWQCPRSLRAFHWRQRGELNRRGKKKKKTEAIAAFAGRDRPNSKASNTQEGLLLVSAVEIEQLPPVRRSVHHGLKPRTGASGDIRPMWNYS